jgi:hypothetical protein
MKVAECILKSKKITKGPLINVCSGSKTFRIGL